MLCRGSMLKAFAPNGPTSYVSCPIPNDHEPLYFGPHFGSCAAAVRNPWPAAALSFRMTASATSVIIVGAGPVGLGLACDLGQRGVDCILIEKRDGAMTVPKQSMVSARNMEFCRRWGIAQ